MTRFDVPCCSVCYEYLARDLCVLSRCGHVYHRACLVQWTAKTAKQSPGCPLCRCDISQKGVIDLKFECGEYHSTAKQESSDGNCAPSDTAAETLSQNELEDLRHRLAQAVTDKLDLHERCISIEKENTELQETVLRIQDNNAELDSENKDLKLVVAANKASIAKLTELLDKQKAKLAKLESIHQYLNAEENTGEGFNTYLKTLSPAERMTLLTNRVAELEGINKTLTDLRDVWKKKCDKLSRDYLILEREYKSLVVMRSEPTAAQQFSPDPLNEPFAVNSKSGDQEDHDVPRKMPRSMDFGFIRNGDVLGAHNTPTRDVRPTVFGFGSEGKTSKALKAKPQKIVKFFKSQ